MHAALAEREPHNYWAAQPGNEHLGISPSMEDAAIAYRLLTEVLFRPGLSLTLFLWVLEVHVAGFGGVQGHAWLTHVGVRGELERETLQGKQGSLVKLPVA